MPILNGSNERFDHFGRGVITTELIELSEPKVIAAVICVLCVVGIAPQISEVLHQHKSPVELSVDKVRSVGDDAQYLAYWVEPTNYKLAIVSIEGGAPKDIFEIAPQANFRYGTKWTPDGKAIVYRDWISGIWRQPVDGGAREQLQGLPDEKIGSIGWSRDGKLFAFARAVVPRDVVLITSER